MARMNPEINAGSMADIAFLLLIFFLVTTTMDIDAGILRILPPPVEEDADRPEVRERNVMVVLVDQFDRLMVRGQLEDVRNLRNRTKEFISNPTNDPNMPVKEKRYIENLGEVDISRGIISLQNDRNTSYEMYITVQNELAAGINDLRDNLSRQFFGRGFEELNDEDQIRAIRTAVPMAISEAEPRDIGGQR